MAKTCMKCGRNIGIFSNDPFECNGAVLCFECAKPIHNDINSLYYRKSRKGFLELRDKIIKTSTEHYSADIVDSITQKVNTIYSQMKPYLENDIPEENSELNKAENNEPQESNNTTHSTSQSDFSFDNLYANIGKKIKGLAKWIFIIEAIGAIVTGIALLTIDEDLVLSGLLTLLCGPIVAWIGSWITYAFGELVEKTSANEQNTRNILKIMQKSNKKD